MSLPSPRLDDRTYADLIEEARALIPSLFPEWTDHNPADPGITLIELFAWLTEMLIYRVDRLTDDHVRTFLKLLNGPHGGPDLEADVRETVTALRRRYRAVTGEDFEALSHEAAPQQVARAWCVARRDLTAPTAAGRQTEAPGHLSTILVPTPEAADPAAVTGAPVPPPALLEEVWQYLEPCRLLTTRHHVVAPTYAPLAAEILLAREAGADPQSVHDRVLEALVTFLHPLAGGPRGDGWPLGRDVYASELYALLDQVAGVDHVADVALASQCPEGAAHCEAAAVEWHDNGGLIGLGLEAHHLPWALIDPQAVVSGEILVPIKLTVAVTPVAGVAARQVRRAAKQEVRRLFHPLHDGPTGEAAWEISLDLVRVRLQNLAEIAAVGTIDVAGPPGRSFGAQTLELTAGELAEVTTHVELV